MGFVHFTSKPKAPFSCASHTWGRFSSATYRTHLSFHKALFTVLIPTSSHRQFTDLFNIIQLKMATTFPRFIALPKELQIEIWRYALTVIDPEGALVGLENLRMYDFGVRTY